MQVIVHFADGEVMEGSSEAMTLSKMGFPFVPHSGNNELVWISLSSIKYVVILGGNLEPALGGDPREGRGLPKIVIRFHDGETIRTYRDDSWGQESEGFNIRIWEPKLQAVVRVLVSLHSIKGIFFVRDWDSRSESERLEFATKTKAGPARPKAAARPAPGEPDAQMVQLTLKYRQRLARLSDPDLTSGDPVVFGRGGEEALALAAAGIPCEIVPGVSSAVAAPALSGIPVTHRGLASAFVVVSGHAEEAYGPVLRSLEPGAATLVILMGIGTRAATSAMLLERGWPADTPAAVLFSASRPDAFTWWGTLAGVASAPRSEAPGIIVIGATVALASQLQTAHEGGQRAAAR